MTRVVVDFSVRQAQDPEPVEGHLGDQRSRFVHSTGYMSKRVYIIEIKQLKPRISQMYTDIQSNAGQ